MDVLNEVLTERLNQDETWGEQNHENIFGESMRRGFETAAWNWKQINASRVADGRITWDGILLEEVYEAVSSKSVEELRAELVQVAAVASAWVEAIDRSSVVDSVEDEEAPA